ncbi:hypothetical protein MMC10_001697 [Thelotrema lepadinum]|nr:hypothetical protein [Thelotrema lepadinum]
MRLIEAKTLKLVEVLGENVKEYAILSHRWGEQEVSFRAMQDLKTASTMKGFAKIQMSCDQAVKHGLDYVWIDTCCIDKDSSAELSEAINSMYRWYEASSVCYAFLEDVQEYSDEMKHSVWFSRGWTLQELIAPQHVTFFDRQWRNLGTKQSMSKDLARWTGIDLAILEGTKSLAHCSVANRMSWASKRATTRIEDTAYCLLGIFDVNMPLLYGEGEKAFLRLQMEIIKESDDHTIFAWPLDRDDQPGLLARSPKLFENCASVELRNTRDSRASYSMTNRGLSMKFIAVAHSVDTYLVPLDCFDKSMLEHTQQEWEIRLGIFLKRLGQDDQYARVRFDGVSLKHCKVSTWAPTVDENFIKDGPNCRTVLPAKELDVNVRQYFTGRFSFDDMYSVNGFELADKGLLARSPGVGTDPFKIIGCDWNQQTRLMYPNPQNLAPLGFIDTTREDHKVQQIMLGFDNYFNPLCLVATSRSYWNGRQFIATTGTEKKRKQMSDIVHGTWTSAFTRAHVGHDRRSDWWKAYSKKTGGAFDIVAIGGDRITGFETSFEGNSMFASLKRRKFGKDLVWTFSIFERPASQWA